MEYWIVGVLDCWNRGMLELWNSYHEAARF
jgi:hypothetical protein